MNTKGQMHLAAFHSPPGSWRMPGAKPCDMDWGETLEFVQIAERGKLDLVFFQDAASVAAAFYLSGGEALANAARCVRLEPLTVLAALAAQTSRIGLIATASTTYNEPYSIARKFATIDHISGGRAGWNVVTSQNVHEAQNFNQSEHMEHGLRYERAEEFLDVVKGLWDSWEDDAVIRDRESGRYIEPSKLHVLDHKGKHFSVRGPLNVARAPQGHPVIAQAGSSEPGRDLAARTADLVFTAQVELGEAQEFYADMKARAARYGRNPDHLKIMPGIVPVLADTVEQARADHDLMVTGYSEDAALASVQRLCGTLNIRDYPLDGPLPDLPPSNSAKARQKMMIDLARRENLTIRQLARRFILGLGHQVYIGQPQGMADLMQNWFEAGACDGFILASPYYVEPLRRFVDTVVPELQDRDLFRRDYEGTTLREHLGIPYLPNRHAEQKQAVS